MDSGGVSEAEALSSRELPNSYVCKRDLLRCSVMLIVCLKRDVQLQER